MYGHLNVGKGCVNEGWAVGWASLAHTLQRVYMECVWEAFEHHKFDQQLRTKGVHSLVHRKDKRKSA